MNDTTVTIKPEELHFDFIRASGPGGQNVNKVATAVQLRFNVLNSRSISPEVRDRLIKIAGKRMNSSGEIIIESKRYRTQQRNREDAVLRLAQMIEKAGEVPKARKKSRPTVSSKLKRLNDKKHRSDVKKLRGRAGGEE
jgi:ribosome-associated protein